MAVLKAAVSESDTEWQIGMLTPGVPYLLAGKELVAVILPPFSERYAWFRAHPNTYRVLRAQGGTQAAPHAAGTVLSPFGRAARTHGLQRLRLSRLRQRARHHRELGHNHR